MPTMHEVARAVVARVDSHGCDEGYYDQLAHLRGQIGGHPNDILPVLREVGLAEALIDRAQRVRREDPEEAQRLLGRAERLDPAYQPTNPRQATPALV